MAEMCAQVKRCCSQRAHCLHVCSALRASRNTVQAHASNDT